ncbi:hypothetical protein HanRHA438_Chr15g0702281 [Helianthus annuus]|uniref:Uncharacterized protein n=1 Tax=Helianthus annuus TaxID=4232 RepID=A0A251S9N8_HELAN|nr:hypothetical protein HanXRQr2_Chr15g0689891 [Helianthus annuus]KAJ0450958.1 hypothetical protein HanHA300_Chr15g0562121 [Helianthus annuus]KAJ0455313.1 hypothetical protein HanIR_Chr15g0749761 [Helianthus annuus]KAJ0472817.1 hypothetical protein HanHA89_Chr15g0611321 [Helianthus annuus]KAJ0648425.1 hypothetical protein HanLR1_Chr15g0572741 [Helianthus annuus]
MNIIFAFFLFTRVQPNVFAYRDQDLQDFLTRHIDQDLQDLLHENPSVYLSLIKIYEICSMKTPLFTSRC